MTVQAPIHEQQAEMVERLVAEAMDTLREEASERERDDSTAIARERLPVLCADAVTAREVAMARVGASA